MDALLASIPPALHVHTASVIIANGTDPNMTWQAIDFLRQKAIEGRVDAMAKLCVADRIPGSPIDAHEAALWSRCLLDAHFSAALTAYCSNQLPLQKSIMDLAWKDAEDQNIDAVYLVGLVLLQGIGIQPDRQRGLDLLKQAYSLGHASASAELARYAGQRNLVYHEDAVASIMKRPHSLSHHDAQLLADLAYLYLTHGDMNKAYEVARFAAETLGEPSCQWLVGDMLFRGQFVPAEVAQGLFWLEQSGDQGYPPAIETMARLYSQGNAATGIVADPALAQTWCLRGDVLWPSGLGFCQARLGDMYDRGWGVPRDPVRAFEYFQKASSHADSPQSDASLRLGNMFVRGEPPCERRPDLAAVYYRLAARAGHLEARARLGALESIPPPPEHTQPGRSWRPLSLLLGQQNVLRRASALFSPSYIPTDNA